MDVIVVLFQWKVQKEEYALKAPWHSEGIDSLIENCNKYCQVISAFIEYESNFAVAAIVWKHPVMLDVGYLMYSICQHLKLPACMAI